MEKNNPYVVTVGRQFGSGGRQIGQALAQRLGIEYYDRRLLADAAQAAGLSDEFFERQDERFPRFLSGMFSFAQGFMPVTALPGDSPVSSDRVYGSLSDFIRRLAAEKSCVIVGRTADYILRDHPRCVSIFVHAPMEHCVKRIMERNDVDTPQKAQALAEKTNKLRAGYYNFYTDKQWGHATSYDLTLDSSKLSTEDIVETIVDFMRRRGVLDPDVNLASAF